MKLADYFERIYVINLPYKDDRKLRLGKHLQSMGLAEPEEIEWVRAISGDWCPPPAWFGAGNGAWGCLQSHLRIAQDATMDRLANYLVLEDDVCFHAQAGNHLKKFMTEVPGDWSQIYLGGQHLNDPDPIEGLPFVFRCRNINRTHAFALRADAFTAFQQHIAHAPDYIARKSWHVDHQLGLAHERGAWKAYAPTWWIAGQDEGSSNISGRINPRMWWHYYGYSSNLPFLYFDREPDGEVAGKLLRHVHFGNNLKEGTHEDIGLDRCVGSPGELHAWLKMIAREAMDRWLLPGIRHERISLPEVEECWGGRVIRPFERNLEELAGYPANGLFPHPLNSKDPAALLSDAVVQIRRTSAA